MNKDDRIRWIRAHLINSEFFPKMMSDMIIAPQNVVYTLIMNTPSFLKKLSVKEQQIVKTIDKEGFQKLDTSLMYKCIRHFHLVGEPTDQWGAPVLQTSSTQGDDVERLHKLRNNISHLPKPILSESEFTEFMSTCFEVALRRDSSLKSPGNRFLAEIREYGTLQIMDSNLEKKYVSLLEENNFLKEQAQQMVGNRKVTIFYGQDVEDKIAGDTSKELSCIVYIYGAHLSDEGMKKTGEFFKNLNESILNVRVQRIGTGSIILYVIIYKEAMKDKTCLHNSLCIIMEKMFPFFHDFGRCEKTIQIALYAAQGFFADNASDSLSYLSDESAAVSFDCKLPRDKIAMNNVLFEYAGNVFMNKTNETETKSASELNVVVTPKNKVTKCQKCQALGDFNYHDDNNYLQIEEGDIIDIIDFEESDWILGQKGNIKGLVPKSHVRLLKHQPDSSATLPPLPVRQKCQTLPTKNLLLDTTENTYGNDDWLFETMNDKCKNEVDKKKLDAPCPENHYIQDKPPVLPKRQRKIQQNNEQSLNPMEFTYENVTENSNDKPPVLPKRPTKIHLNKVQSLNPIESTYGNMSEYSYGKRDKNEIRFVMVGRTGSGKSATGNTIMAKADHFESRLAGGSVTRECQRGECIQAGRNIVLVDTPGLFDSQVSSEQTWKEIIRCVNMSTPGPHAFLIVIQIARFTDEEIEKFNRLFDLFGNGMGKFAIITFTKLDDLEREQTTIEEYIETAPQKLKDFLNRCQGRYIAIDNKASEKKKAAKVNNLIQLVDAIVNKNGGKCYTNEMYREAEAALQRKIKEVEEEKAREKKKEIDQIQSKFTHQIDFIKKDNRKLAKVVFGNKFVQRSFRTAKENAQQETNRIKDEMKMIDKKRNEEIYFIKKKEKEENEKLARDLEQKERQNMQLLQNLQQQQAETNRRYQEMERQKELQLSKVTEDHNKRMEAEIQWIVDGSNEKYKNMMQALETKDKGYEKLQQQMAQQNLKMQEIMREKDKEFLKQQDENRKRMELEKDRSNETLRDQIDEQKRSLDATRDILLQEQKERDQRQREEYQELKRQYERTQEQMKSKGCMQS